MNSLIILLTTSLASVAALGTGRQICVAGASTDFAADVYVGNSASATSLRKLTSIRQGQKPQSFPNDSSTIMKYVVTAGSLGTGKIWVQGPATGSAEVDLSGPTGQTPITGIDISGLASPRQLVVAGGPTGLRLTIYVGNAASGSFAALQTIAVDANGTALVPISDSSAFMKYTADLGTPTSATRVYITGGDLSPTFKARCVATSIGANTVSGQILSVTATGALAAQDGVTVAVGDVVLFPAGLSNVTTGEAGPWTSLTLGDTTTVASFMRPSWWQNGQVIPSTNTPIRVGSAGTLFGTTTWRNTNGGGTTVIGTDEPQLFPDFVSQIVTLSTGAVTATNVPIAATKSSVRFERTAVGGTVTTTIMYAQSAITAGPLGTATVTVQAQIATGGVQTSDTSTGRLVITNFA